jgi:hypothetical protein
MCGPFVVGSICQPLAMKNNWCEPHHVSALTPRLPNNLLPVSPLPRRLATVKSTQCNCRPTPITLQTSLPLQNSEYFPNLPIAGPAGQDGAGLARGVYGFSSSLLAAGHITRILHEPGDGVFEWTGGGGGDAGGLSLPRCWPGISGSGH